MTGPSLRRALAAFAVTALAAGPALAQPTSAPEAKAVRSAETAAHSQAADARAYAAQTSTVSRGARDAGNQAKPAKARSNSRTAREVWRERHQLPNAR